MNTTTQTRLSGITVLGWKLVKKSTLLGFVTVRLPSGLIVSDITVHSSAGKTWVNLPGKPMLDRDGQAMRDPATGKPKFTKILEWANKATADKFSTAVIAALEAEHPGAMQS